MCVCVKVLCRCSLPPVAATAVAACWCLDRALLLTLSIYLCVCVLLLLLLLLLFCCVLFVDSSSGSVRHSVPRVRRTAHVQPGAEQPRAQVSAFPRLLVVVRQLGAGCGSQQHCPPLRHWP